MILCSQVVCSCFEAVKEILFLDLQMVINQEQLSAVEGHLRLQNLTLMDSNVHLFKNK